MLQMARFIRLCCILLILECFIPWSQCEQVACKVCDNSCKPPHCSCVKKEIPGNLTAQSTPQMVAFTFDDAVHDTLYTTLTELFPEERKNPNGSPVSMTMYVSDEYTDHCAVRKLWEKGHEIASHSVTHRLPKSWWAGASQKQWKEEMVGLKEKLVKRTKIPAEDVIGMRVPFLQGGGNTMFRMIEEDSDFLYDSTLVDGGSQTERYWPYSLDYNHSALGCTISPCPTNCYKGLWEVPLGIIIDNSSKTCSFWDKCSHQPTNEKQAHYMFRKFFEASYHHNRAPVLYNIHAEWLRDNIHANKGLVLFLDEILKKDDVYVITVNQVLEWIKDPTSLENIQNFKPWKQQKRGKRLCTITRETISTPLFLSGSVVVALECVFLAFLAICLIARDSEE